jgi:ABC-type methionine transport system ATPase subunit
MGDKNRQMKKLNVTITATAEQITEPILWKLGQDYKVKVNLQKASFTESGGSAVVELQGDVSELQRAIAWLQTTGVIMETSERAMFPKVKPG